MFFSLEKNSHAFIITQDVAANKYDDARTNNNHNSTEFPAETELDSSDSEVNGFVLDDRSSFLAGVRIYFADHIQTGCRTHTASHKKSTASLSQG
jgi:hypothetical protein